MFYGFYHGIHHHVSPIFWENIFGSLFPCTSKSRKFKSRVAHWCGWIREWLQIVEAVEWWRYDEDCKIFSRQYTVFVCWQTGNSFIGLTSLLSTSHIIFRLAMQSASCMMNPTMYPSGIHVSGQIIATSHDLTSKGKQIGTIFCIWGSIYASQRGKMKFSWVCFKISGPYSWGKVNKVFAVRYCRWTRYVQSMREMESHPRPANVFNIMCVWDMWCSGVWFLVSISLNPWKKKTKNWSLGGRGV